MHHLGHLESAIMERMWSRSAPASVREILVDLQRDRDLAYMTVKTVMDTLHRKGLLSREPDGRAFRYRPTQTREQYTASHMGEVLASGSDRRATLLHFLEQIPAEDLAQLREALDQAAGPQTGTAQ
ncbi:MULTISPECIES: BlaI/MecI/CopY family transcriptional regulator [Kocuria]|nr:MULTISPECIES: BlaI/MecI/CopY family transcriptional regulator [Kocuria]MDT0119019.1 BlaI/MecI/CopY family transcriptional regulator [Kocuria sp. PD6]OXS82045.1 CopY family transcriptional regulator [Kocuria indica]RLP57403.1 BlaI/MecI/CopY family transcriptional regulator [Kocuria indica]SMF16513.1 Predicted transcriptional regulator [Kocuria indica]